MFEKERKKERMKISFHFQDVYPSQMTTAKSRKWQPTQPRNAFFHFGSMKEITSMMVALLMMILTPLESSGALPRLTQTTYTSAGAVTGVNVGKIATLKKKVKVSLD